VTKVNVNQLPQQGVKSLELQFPDGWDVHIANMNGHDRRPLTIDAVRASLQKPLGTKTIQELAKGKNEVAIIFDDYARGSKWGDIATLVLEDLAAAGIPDENIRFICGLGNHGTGNRTDMVRKLNEDIVSRYMVVNHNAFVNCKEVGTTKNWGTKIEANGELMECDLKIALGVTCPHPIAGFGGGTKAILPGVVSYQTIVDNHANSFKAAFAAMKESQEKGTPPTIGMAVYGDSHPVVDDSDEAAEMVGLDFVINTLVNSRGEHVSVYAGHYHEVHMAAIKEGKSHYLTPHVKNTDIVIANAFYKANENLIALFATPNSLKREGGDLVLINNCPEGQVPHYYAGEWGKFSRGVGATPSQLAPFVNNCILYNEYKYPGSFWPMEPKEKLRQMDKWADVITLLKKLHGDQAKVVVYPNATIQYIAITEKSRHDAVCPAH
jgi:nickel-dependent lactate racemase